MQAASGELAPNPRPPNFRHVQIQVAGPRGYQVAVACPTKATCRAALDFEMRRAQAIDTAAIVVTAYATPERLGRHYVLSAFVNRGGRWERVQCGSDDSDDPAQVRATQPEPPPRVEVPRVSPFTAAPLPRPPRPPPPERRAEATEVRYSVRRAPATGAWSLSYTDDRDGHRHTTPVFVGYSRLLASEKAHDLAASRMRREPTLRRAIVSIEGERDEMYVRERDA